MSDAVEPYVDLDAGLVDRRIFSDPEIYRSELERVFGRCWLFLAHESQIPRPGDYVTNSMAEDSVIVCRDTHGKVRAFLNTCRHRGNRICLYQQGRAASFTCSYHGWTYNTEGKLVGVPFLDDAYYGELDREQLGLVEVPRVEIYGEWIFGCWDPKAIPLREYLGDLCWYLDNVYLAADMGGLEVLPGVQRYLDPGNWKISADNFAGDNYHVPSTHGSVFRLGMRDARPRAAQSEATPERNGPFGVLIEPGHGIGGIITGPEPYERDLAQAEPLGPEVVDWVKERYRHLLERLKDTPAKPYGITHANIFPNFSFNGASGAFQTRGFYLWHPRGPNEMEIWHYALVERAAPRVVKEMLAHSSGSQSATGFFGQDDNENFERVNENTRTPIARRYPFNYAMRLGYDGKWPGREQWNIEGMPGLVGPNVSEHAQRRFYAYWAELMSEGGTDGGANGAARAAARDRGVPVPRGVAAR